MVLEQFPLLISHLLVRQSPGGRTLHSVPVHGPRHCFFPFTHLKKAPTEQPSGVLSSHGAPPTPDCAGESVGAGVAWESVVVGAAFVVVVVPDGVENATVTSGLK